MTVDSPRRFLVLHGWQSRRPPEHWHWQLVEELRAAGEQVLYPQLPNTDGPSLTEWSALLRAELAQLGSGERIVVAHSLSVPLWLHTSTMITPEERVDRVLLVSPPSPAVLAPHAEVLEFARVRPDRAALARAAVSTRVVASDGDPFSPEGPAAALTGLDLDTDFLSGAGHINPDSGYGHWPSVAAWCRDRATRLTTR